VSNMRADHRAHLPRSPLHALRTLLARLTWVG
jgi:hypothetical protein